MKTLTISLALTFLLTGCAERKSDAYQTLQVERDTLAPLAAQLEAEKAELEAQLDALKSGADTSEVPKTLPDRIKLTDATPRAHFSKRLNLSVRMTRQQMRCCMVPRRLREAEGSVRITSSFKPRMAAPGHKCSNSVLPSFTSSPNASSGDRSVACCSFVRCRLKTIRSSLVRPMEIISRRP